MNFLKGNTCHKLSPTMQVAEISFTNGAKLLKPSEQPPTSVSIASLSATFAQSLNNLLPARFSAK